jgi:DNA-binding MarR family transcriptional regulator
VADRATGDAHAEPNESSPDSSLSLEIEEVEHGLTALVAKAFFYTRRVFDEAMRPYGVTASQAAALNRIYGHPGISGAEISRQMGTTPQAVRLTLTTLERKGLVERRPDPDNGRIVKTYLSEKGRSVILRCRAEATKVEQQLAQNVGDIDRRMMIQFLARYLDDPKQTADREPVGEDERGKESAPAWSLDVRGAEEDDHE